MHRLLLLFAFLLLPSAAASGDLQGKAVVVNSSIIAIQGKRYRLHGIDPPVSNQRCELGNGTKWFCGRSAAAVLRLLVHERHAECAIVSEARADVREPSVRCRALDVDIGEEMLRRGMAWAGDHAPQAYLDAQASAMTERKGVFQAETEPAQALRRRLWAQTSASAPNSCPIKGNVDGFGRRIYHLPWSQWYALTKVTRAKGDRWFCSEREAVNAGWQIAEWDFVPRLDPDDLPAGGVLGNQR